jgi:cytidylate kinase
MSQAIVERYLKAQAAEAKAAADKHKGPRAHPFLTISRQAGAGGTTLADRLLHAFGDEDDQDLFGGWQIFDRRLCEIVAKDPNYRHSIDALLTEEYPSRTADFFRQVIGSTIDHGVLMDRVFRVVRSLAAIGKAIIIGRAGSQVTKDMPNGLSLRLAAPEERRIQHLAELEELTERKARSEVKRRDDARARLLRTHFSVDIDDPSGYDITWNTGTCTTEEMVDTIITMLRHRAMRTVSRQVTHH